MSIQYGTAIYGATVIMMVEEPLEKETVQDDMLDALSEFEDADVVNFRMDDWNKDYECEAEMNVLIRNDCQKISWKSRWNDNGGEPGGCELSSELCSDDIKKAFAKHGLKVSVYLREPEFEAA